MSRVFLLMAVLLLTACGGGDPEDFPPSEESGEREHTGQPCQEGERGECV